MWSVSSVDKKKAQNGEATGGEFTARKVSGSDLTLNPPPLATPLAPVINVIFSQN